MINSSNYEKLMNLLVVIASVFIGMRDNQEPAFATEWNRSVTLVNFLFNLVFTVDSGLKIVAYGFWKHPNSYLRDAFRAIDFALVIIG